MFRSFSSTNWHDTWQRVWSKELKRYDNALLDYFWFRGTKKYWDGNCNGMGTEGWESEIVVPIQLTGRNGVHGKEIPIQFISKFN